MITYKIEAKRENKKFTEITDKLKEAKRLYNFFIKEFKSKKVKFEYIKLSIKENNEWEILSELNFNN